MWWIYFDVGARRGSELIEHDERPGLLGRQAYTYGHIPIVAGIIVLAVADEQVLAHPGRAPANPSTSRRWSAAPCCSSADARCSSG